MIGIQLDNKTQDLRITKKADGLASMTLGETMEQNQFVILKAHQGELKEYPSLGVGIDDYTSDNDVNSLKYSIRENLKIDEMTLESINYKNGVIDIKATY